MKQTLFVLTLLLIVVTGSLAAETTRDTVPGTVIVINAFDAMSTRARLSKKDLFRDLADSLRLYVANQLQANGKQASIVSNILFPSPEFDNDVYALMSERKAATAVVILSLDAYFAETGTRIRSEMNGTKKVMAYDLCVTNHYRVYKTREVVKDTSFQSCAFFTERDLATKSSLLAVGPDIVGKKKHVYPAVADNARQFVWSTGYLYRD